jgi:hypothetical protein
VGASQCCSRALYVRPGYPRDTSVDEERNLAETLATEKGVRLDTGARREVGRRRSYRPAALEVREHLRAPCADAAGTDDEPTPRQYQVDSPFPCRHHRPADTTTVTPRFHSAFSQDCVVRGCVPRVMVVALRRTFTPNHYTGEPSTRSRRISADRHRIGARMGGPLRAQELRVSAGPGMS